MKLYGSLQNRMEENRQFVEEIKVGTGMTEYSWSDRHAYEVIAVKDQKHVTVRELDHKLIGEAYTNDWELISNPENPEMEMVKRGNYWYRAITITKDEVPEGDSCVDENGNLNMNWWLAMNNFDRAVILAKGKQTKYQRMNVSFGVANYYYDYEF